MEARWLFYKPHRSGGYPSGVYRCNGHLWKIRFLDKRFSAWRMNHRCVFTTGRNLNKIVHKIIKFEYLGK